MTTDSPPEVAPQHVIAALSQELTRVNDNRIYLIALVEQLTQELAEVRAGSTEEAPVSR